RAAAARPATCERPARTPEVVLLDPARKAAVGRRIRAAERRGTGSGRVFPASPLTALWSRTAAASRIPDEHLVDDGCPVGIERDVWSHSAYPSKAPEDRNDHRRPGRHDHGGLPPRRGSRGGAAPGGHARRRPGREARRGRPDPDGRQDLLEEAVPRRRAEEARGEGREVRLEADRRPLPL